MPLLALAPILLVFAALMALLIVYGAQAFGRAVASIIPNWHVPFLGNLRDIALAGINLALGTIKGWLESTLQPMARVLAYPIFLIRNFIDEIGANLDSIGGRLLYILSYKIPAVWHSALQFTRDMIGAVQRQILNVLAQAKLLAYAAELAAIHYTQQITGALQTQIRNALTVALRAAFAAEVAAVRYTNDVAGALQTQIKNALTFAITHADAAAAAAERGAITAVNTTVAIADAAVVPTIIDEIRAIEGVLATDLPDIRALVRAVPRAIPRDLAGTLALTGTVEAVMTRYLRECGIPNCKNLGKYGHDFQAITGLVEAGAFLALLLEAAHNPEVAATEVRGLVAGPMHTAAAGLRSTVGL